MATAKADQQRPPLYDVIYAAVKLIPRGKVATYGQIAAIIGKPRAPRAVGRALRELPEVLATRVPWQRVINSAGRCSERGGFYADRQRDRLEAEGITIDRNGKVDLRKVAWKGPTKAALARLQRDMVKKTSKPKSTKRSSWVAERNRPSL